MHTKCDGYDVVLLEEPGGGGGGGGGGGPAQNNGSGMQLFVKPSMKMHGPRARHSTWSQTLKMPTPHLLQSVHMPMLELELAELADEVGGGGGGTPMLDDDLAGGGGGGPGHPKPQGPLLQSESQQLTILTGAEQVEGSPRQ